MRIHVKTSSNTELVPFNYQHKLVGVLHKWLGNNELHGNLSLYSFSWLSNQKSSKAGLNFPNGAKFFISFYDDNYFCRQMLYQYFYNVGRDIKSLQ
jgi:CRISPR/Cas system endoribonuclease Cas6 (RAMP superfamily)